MHLKNIHHVAVICSDYRKSKAFYTEVLGLRIEHEYYRRERGSYKADLSLGGNYVIELFSFPDPPERPSYPEAAGLRHIAFGVEDIGEAVAALEAKDVVCEPVRVDEFTGKRFTFLFDPDRLPIELYEVGEVKSL